MVVQATELYFEEYPNGMMSKTGSKLCNVDSFKDKELLVPFANVLVDENS